MENNNQIIKLFKNYRVKEYLKKEIIINYGNPVTNIFYLKYGYVRSFTNSLQGTEFTLNIFNPGSFFPITTALAKNRINNYSYQSLTKIGVYIAPAELVIDWLRKYPDITFNLLERISSGLEGVLERIQGIINANASQKLSSTLYLLAVKFGERNINGSIRIPFAHNQEILSTIAGLTRETTSIELKKLEKKGLISRINKYTFINNLNKLISTID